MAVYVEAAIDVPARRADPERNTLSIHHLAADSQRKRRGIQIRVSGFPKLRSADYASELYGCGPPGGHRSGGAPFREQPAIGGEQLPDNFHIRREAAIVLDGNLYVDPRRLIGDIGRINVRPG